MQAFFKIKFSIGPFVANYSLLNLAVYSLLPTPAPGGDSFVKLPLFR